MTDPADVTTIVGDGTTVVNVEQIHFVSGEGNDRIRTLDGDDIILGDAGNDILASGGGDDVPWAPAMTYCRPATATTAWRMAAISALIRRMMTR